MTAGLLATSPPYEENGQGYGFDVQRDGPSVELSDAQPSSVFRVTVPVPPSEAGDWVAPREAQVYFDVSLEHTPASPAANTGTGDDLAPWVSIDLLDSGERRFSESGPFLSGWSSWAPLTFTGNCTTGDDCRLEFIVSIQREAIDDADSSTLVHWSMVFSIRSGRDDDDPAAWVVEVEPL